MMIKREGKMEATSQPSQQNDGPPAKRHVRNLLLDKRFQLRWVLRVVLATSVIVAAMGYFLYGTVSDATDQMLAQKLGDINLTAEAMDAFLHQNEQDKLITFWTLLAWLVLLVVLLSSVTIVLTHKIAGPVYKMRKIFASIHGDQLQTWAKLRRGDELQEIFVAFDDMLVRLREHRRTDIEELKKIKDLVEETNESSEVSAGLDTIISRYMESVKME
jgi:nitrogen fixation/metabolism regulation signal transduction histidine kinase